MDSTETLRDLRRRLEYAFGADTASGGFPGTAPSTGHCAAVAAIVHELLGGEMVSTRVEGHSHWLNRLTFGSRTIDADLTGDQFGRPELQVADPGELYPELRVRSEAELTAETLTRAELLAKRAGLSDVSVALRIRRERLTREQHLAAGC
jgi:hypothetical protein